jgi:hypothetical protein
MPRRALFLITVLVLALHWLVLSGVPLAWDNPRSPVGKVFSTRSIAAPPPPAAAVAAVAAVAPIAAKPAVAPKPPARPKPQARATPQPPAAQAPPPASPSTEATAPSTEAGADVALAAPAEAVSTVVEERSPQRQPPLHRHQPRHHQRLSPLKPQQAWTSPRPGLARTTRPTRHHRLCACPRLHGWRLT